MSTQLKDLYSPEFYQRLSATLESLLPDFETKAFLPLIFDAEWKNRELKDRMWHTSKVLHPFFPADFEEAAQVIIQLVNKLIAEGFTHASLEFMFLPDYVERFGLEHFNSSIRVFEHITAFSSCEFAIRPFIVRYADKMIDQMMAWTGHADEHVRRLASEGSRPRLPWAMALPEFKKNPEPILPLLENLKHDPSEYVRRSVANNLNDISKDNPEVTLALSGRWIGNNQETDRLVKHACRTLLKKGDPEALRLFKYGDPGHLEVNHFQILSPEVAMGGALQFSFELSNPGKSPQKVRLEYGLYYLKANGSLSGKVFKISEKIMDPGSVFQCNRKQHFRIITTRKYYPGRHQLSVIINGEEKIRESFELLGG